MSWEPPNSRRFYQDDDLQQAAYWTDNALRLVEETKLPRTWAIKILLKATKFLLDSRLKRLRKNGK